VFALESFGLDGEFKSVMDLFERHRSKVVAPYFVFGGLDKHAPREKRTARGIAVCEESWIHHRTSIRTGLLKPRASTPRGGPVGLLDTYHTPVHDVNPLARRFDLCEA
jgi:hypothetical protein